LSHGGWLVDPTAGVSPWHTCRNLRFGSTKHLFGSKALSSCFNGITIARIGPGSLRVSILIIQANVTSRDGGRLLCHALVMIWIMSAGCTMSVPRYPLPTVDSYTLDVDPIRLREHSKADVARTLGEAPFVLDTSLGTEWFYPVRDIYNTSGRAVPAPMLKVWFDASLRVADWGFFHPMSQKPLDIREGAEEAERWYNSVCNPPAKIETFECAEERRQHEKGCSGRAALVACWRFLFS
jgi:hypothetical protein